MRKILFILWVLPILGYGQNIETVKNPHYKKQKIEGLGNLKINKTNISIIDSLSKLPDVKYDYTAYTLGNIPLKNAESTSLTEMYELKKDSSTLEKEFDTHAVYAKNVKVFYLNYFQAGGIDVNNIYLTFHNGILIKIEIGLQGLHNEVDNAFLTKYGMPVKITTITKPITCQNGFGAVFYYKDEYISSYWTSEINNVVAEKTSSTYYINCKPVYSFSFSIFDEKKMNLINAEQEKNIKVIDSLKNTIPKEKLKDF
ncbi:hypothetical protein [Hanamia caeni]|nr:hypothetical protein [Hanamia caeni]